MVLSFRDPDVQRYRITLLLSRGLSGFALGFANINNFATLLDVFGASLQSDESEEQGSPYDVRRHGGGMGLWLGIWSSCSVGTISIGFLIGAIIINGTSVDWGFWISSLLLMFVTLLNVMAPEVRRSAFRRTIAEITGEGGSFSRVARGEIKFHLTGNGPYWWGEEILAGIRLSWRMVKQPGFLVLSIYGAWVYAQFILVIMVSFRQY
jgi:MFS family permease